MKVPSVAAYLSMIRFSHTIFALPFAALSVVWTLSMPTPEATSSDIVGSAPSSWLRWLGVLSCMVTARSFAMAWNRWADAEIDGRNLRTQNRHIPSGQLSSTAVMVFAVACGSLFIASCLLFLPNWIPLLSSLPVLAFLAGYSYAKRWTWAVHFWLGTALMLAPICAWVAVRGEVVMAKPIDLLPAIWLGLSVLFWVAGFDIIYACQDEAFDRAEKLQSLPAWIGATGALRVAALCHAIMWVLLLGLGWLVPDLSLGWIWWLAVLAIGGLLCYEHWIVDPRDLSRVNTAFFHVNAVISSVLFAVGSIDSIWR